MRRRKLTSWEYKAIFHSDVQSREKEIKSLCSRFGRIDKLSFKVAQKIGALVNEQKNYLKIIKDNNGIQKWWENQNHGYSWKSIQRWRDYHKYRRELGNDGIIQKSKADEKIKQYKKEARVARGDEGLLPDEEARAEIKKLAEYYEYGFSSNPDLPQMTQEVMQYFIARYNDEHPDHKEDITIEAILYKASWLDKEMNQEQLEEEGRKARREMRFLQYK